MKWNVFRLILLFFYKIEEKELTGVLNESLFTQNAVTSEFGAGAEVPDPFAPTVQLRCMIVASALVSTVLVITARGYHLP